MRVLLLLAALFSGAASLALEVVWSKALVVPLGNSSDATATVLAGFMLGIAGGALLGARIARRSARALPTYALLELLLAAFALVVPRLLELLTDLSIPSRWLDWTGAAFGLRLTVALCLIVTPCLVMGATLPLLLGAMARGDSRHRSIALLYGANTLGATISSIVAGFYGIANWGIAGCSRRAAIGSSAAALLAVAGHIALRRSNTPGPEEVQIEEVERARALQSGDLTESSDGFGERGERHIALFVTSVSGFVLLSAEVFWARVLTFVFGHDTYAFATLLGTVLLGLALGGLAYTRFEQLIPRRVATWAMVLTALSLLTSFYISSGLLIARGRDPFGIGDRFIGTGALSLEMLREFAFTPLLVLLPCFFSGLAYPATIVWYAGTRRSPAQATGIVGLANGVGATLGAGLTSLGLVGWLGIQGVLSCIALLSVACATWCMVVQRRLPWSSRLVRVAPLLLTVATIVVVPRDLPRRMLLSVVGPRHQSLLLYEEARTATVSVIRNSIQGERQLLVNAVNEVTTRLVHDQSFKLLGQLGPLLHPNPKQAVMICLGAGLAAGSALTHPLEHLDVVDLLEAVRRGARHFAEENNHVLYDPRLKLHVDDGRQFLLTTAQRYDIAIVDSTHPKSVDSWILYTREFFQLLRSRLNPDGIVVQWLPLHGLSEREFIAVVATFAAVFPQMTLWASVGYETYGQVGYAKLVGQHSAAPMRIDVARLQSRLALPAVQRDLARYGMGKLPEILDQFVAAPAKVNAWTRGSPILTDDRPLLAYHTALTRGCAMTPERLLAVRESVAPYLTGATADAPVTRADTERSFEAQGLVIAGQLEQAARFDRDSEKIRYYVEQTKTTLPYYMAIAARYPDDAERLFEAGTQLGAVGQNDVAKTVLAAGLERNPQSLRLGLNSALVTLASGDARSAANALSLLSMRHPRSALVHHNLGVALLAQGEAGAARRSLLTAMSIDSQAANTRLILAETELGLRNWRQASRLLEDLVLDEPRLEHATFLLAQVAEQSGNSARAADLFGRAAQLSPYNETHLVEWAKRLVDKQPDEAIRILERAGRLRPDSANVHIALGEALMRQERWQDASLQFVNALEDNPQAKDAALGLGRALLRLRRRQEAKDAFCLAQKLGAPHSRALAEMAAIGEKVDVCAANLAAP